MRTTSNRTAESLAYLQYPRLFVLLAEKARSRRFFFLQNGEEGGSNELSTASSRYYVVSSIGSLNSSLNLSFGCALGWPSSSAALLIEFSNCLPVAAPFARARALQALNLCCFFHPIIGFTFALVDKPTKARSTQFPSRWLYIYIYPYTRSRQSYHSFDYLCAHELFNQWHSTRMSCLC